MDERMKAAKLKVEGLKASVTAMMAQVSDARDRARGSVPYNASLHRLHAERKKQLAAVQLKLQEAKAELVKLSGTGEGGCPKWKLIRECYHLLSALEESGVDITDRGHALIDDIEFHVPMARLQQDIDERTETPTP